MKTKVENMTSPRTGEPVANQFVVTVGSKQIFQSYSSVIAIKQNGKVTLDRVKWDYSNTTGKYRNAFLNESKAETQAKINAGIYKLRNLN